MAKVTITIEDKEDGEINLVAESVPPFPGGKSDRENTSAQGLALVMMGAAMKTAGGHAETSFDEADADED
jgi:hypothetical protein